jgi:hypothetical protein
MSAAVRQILANAANTVSGVKCTPYFTQSLAAGSASVRLDRVEYPNRFGGVAHWQVIVFLPQELAAAEKWLDAKMPALHEALDGELVITSIGIQQVVVEAGTALLSAVVAGHREQE